MLRSLLRCCAAFLVFAAASALAQGDPGDDLPGYRAADTSMGAVTAQNLLASERFWPYQVALARPWRPPGRSEPLAPGMPGVLIRVEESGVARIDFGRDGLHEVPVEATDLVEGANRVRRGELEKLAPNFVLDVGPRLADPSADALRLLGLRAAAAHEAFLCVFADPGAAGFAELAGALAPLRERSGLLTVLFAQGEHPDERLREQLRALAWPVPFVLDHLAEPYTRSLLPERMPPPALLLVSPEGRVLLASAWGPPARAALDEALAKLEVR
jgi:hypothetical protein